MPEDEVIKKNVVDQLYWDDRVDASDIKVEVDNGIVTLEGTVPNLKIRERAYNDAFLIDGVKTVVSNLNVSYQGVVPTDLELESDIKNTLLWNPDLDSTKIGVTVKEGIATLKGTVDAHWKKRAVDRNAANVLGVVSVLNEVAIVPSQKAADEIIAKDISDAFWRNANIDPEEIEVKVNDGVVELSGRVPTWYVKNEVIDTASFTPGVLEVDETKLAVA